MDHLNRIARFADLHDRPQPSRVIDGAVRIYSLENRAGEFVVVHEDVTTMAQARAVLGY